MSEFWVSYIFFLVGSLIVFFPDISHGTLDRRSLLTAFSFIPLSNSFNLFAASSIYSVKTQGNDSDVGMLLGGIIVLVCLMVSVSLEKKSVFLNVPFETGRFDIVASRSAVFVSFGLFLSCLVVWVFPTPGSPSFSVLYVSGVCSITGLLFRKLYIDVARSEREMLRETVREGIRTSVRRCVIAPKHFQSLLQEDRKSLTKLREDTVLRVQNLSSQAPVENIGRNVEAVRSRKVSEQDFVEIFNEEQTSLMFVTEIWLRLIDILIHDDEGMVNEAVTYLKDRGNIVEENPRVDLTLGRRLCEFVFEIVAYPVFKGKMHKGSEQRRVLGYFPSSLSSDDWPSEQLIERFIQHRAKIV